MPKVLVRAPPGHSWHTGPLWASDRQMPEASPLGLSERASVQCPAGRVSRVQAGLVPPWAVPRPVVHVKGSDSSSPLYSRHRWAGLFFIRFRAFTNTSYH